jgi:hypothetical protein
MGATELFQCRRIDESSALCLQTIVTRVALWFKQSQDRIGAARQVQSYASAYQPTVRGETSGATN